ncbi:MAG: ABC transporter substrate-binding protein [Chitinophagales bacterium]
MLDDADSILPVGCGKCGDQSLALGPDNFHPTNGHTAAAPECCSIPTTFNAQRSYFVVYTGYCSRCPRRRYQWFARYTFHLRKDAKWDDGSIINAQDVDFTLRANALSLTDNPQSKSYFENIADVILYPDDPYKITIVMKLVSVQGLEFLTDYPIMEQNYYDPKHILSGYAFSALGDPAMDHSKDKKLTEWASAFNDPKYGNDISMLNASGPYRIVSWDRGQQLVLERKAQNWTFDIPTKNAYQTSYPEKIIFKIVRDPNAQMLEFKSQTMDVSAWMSTENVLSLMSDSSFLQNYNVGFVDRFDYNYIGLNMRPDGVTHQKLFEDVRVRRAMAYLVPLDDIIEVLAHGYAKRQASCVSPLKPEYNNALALIPCDVEKAKALLDEAGWKDSDGDNIRDKIIDGKKVDFRFECKYQAGPAFIQEIARLMQEKMRLAGVEMTGVPIEPNTLSEQLQQHDFDMYMGAWAGSSSSEDFSQLWGSENYTNGGSNYCGFGNAATDALIDSINVTLDTAARFPMIRRFQQIVYDEQPYIFMYAAARKVVIHKRFGNQDMTFERPGVVLNNLRLLSAYGKTGSAVKETNMH